MNCCDFLKLFVPVMIGSVFAGWCGTVDPKFQTADEGTTVQFRLTGLSQGAWIKWYYVNGTLNHPILLCDSKTKHCKNKNTLLKDGYTLSIKTVTHSDSGEYLCYCDNQENTERSSSGTLNVKRVRTHIKPVFQNVHNIYGCGECLYAQESREQTVECYTERVTDEDELTLSFKDNTVNTTIVHEPPRLTIAYKYIPQADDLLSEFSCSLSSPSLEKTRPETKTKVYILKKPSIKHEHIHLRENETTTLSCTSLEGRPPLTPTMTLGTRILDTNQSILENAVSFRYNVTSTFLTSFSRNNITESLKCCVGFFGLCQENPLNLMYPPLEVNLVETYKNNSKDGSTELTLNCSSGVSNPRSNIHWHLPSDTQKQSHAAMDNKTTAAAAVHEVIQVSLTNRHNGQSISCSVTNKEFPEVNLTSTHTVNITYEPIIKISDVWRRKVKVGDDITLRCNVDSNPPATIGWYQGETLVSGGCDLLRRQCDTSANNKLDLHLKNISTDSSRLYRCIAKSTIATVHSEIVKLDVIEPATNFKNSSTLEDTNQVTTIIVVAAVVAVGVALTAIVVAIICKKQKKGDIHEASRKPSPTQTYLEGADCQSNSLPKDSAAGQPHSRQLSEGVTSDVQHEAGYSPGALYDQQALGSASEQINSDYATVVPKKDRICCIQQRDTNKAVVKEEESATEYATVVKSRKPSCSLEQTTQGIKDKNEHGLVYADLDLVSGPQREAASKEHEAIEYVSIDFQKTATLKSQQK